jgi:hypothetical protein
MHCSPLLTNTNSQPFRLRFSADTSLPHWQDIAVSPVFSQHIHVKSKRKERKRKIQTCDAAGSDQSTHQQLQRRDDNDDDGSYNGNDNNNQDHYDTGDHSSSCDDNNNDTFDIAQIDMPALAVELLRTAEWDVIGFAKDDDTGSANTEQTISICLVCEARHTAGRGFSRVHAPGCALRALLDDYSALVNNSDLTAGDEHSMQVSAAETSNQADLISRAVVLLQQLEWRMDGYYWQDTNAEQREALMSSYCCTAKHSSSDSDNADVMHHNGCDLRHLLDVHALKLSEDGQFADSVPAAALHSS